MEKADFKNYSMRVLKTDREKLMISLPFLARALYELTPEPDSEEIAGYGTDGRRFFFESERLVRDFLSSDTDTSLLYLHSVIHCLYMHPFFAASHKNPVLWDLSCDISTWDIAISMGFPAESELKETLSQIRDKTGLLSAQNIYRQLRKSLSSGEIDNSRVESLSGLFKVDSHEAWRNIEESRSPDKNGNGKNGGKKEGSEDDDDKSESENERERRNSGSGESGNPSESERKDNESGNPSENRRKMSQGDDPSESERKNSEGEEPSESQGKGKASADGKSENEDMGEGEAAEGDGYNGNGIGDVGGNNNVSDANDSGKSQDMRDLLERWRDIATHAEVGLEMELSRRKSRGDAAGNALEALRNIERENLDYSEFLKKFACLEERMQVDLDSFDYNYYTYGLELYGDMPLIEPLEYKEKHTIRDFVIAIDTSGSCDSDLVRKFLIKTYDILMQTEIFDSTLNVHILQCDAEIQEDKEIHSAAELSEYAENMVIRGRGGTDFRPVFERIRVLRESGELRNLRGLIYFTDGYGIFPNKPTDYKTAFAIAEANQRMTVPPWALKVYIEEEGL